MPNEIDLPFGLYERLITAGLKARLLRFDPTVIRVVKSDLARKIHEGADFGRDTNAPAW